MFARMDLLAPGAFEDVAVTVAGTATAFASRIEDGGNTGLSWDLARGAALGVPIPAFPGSGDEWAFGALPGPRGDSPVVAWASRGRLHVQDLHSGDEVVIDDADAAFPDLLGLAVHGGRGAVVALNDQPMAGLVVWDARTGERLGTFETWYGHWGPVEQYLLHATPVSGPLVTLTCDSEQTEGHEVVDRFFVSVLDVERGREVAELPSSGRRRSPMVPWEGGIVLVQPESGGGIVVRRPDGEAVASIEMPEDAAEVVAARVDGRLLVAACGREPDVFTVWDAARPEPLGHVRVPAPVEDAALAHDGTLLAATYEGLFHARVSAP